MRTVVELQQQFPGCTETGLTAGQISKSKETFGRNALTPLPREPLWKKFIEKFDEPIIKILLAAALLSMFVEIFRGNPEATPPHPGKPWIAAILLAVFIGGIVGLYVRKMQEWVPTTMFGTAILTFFIGGLVGGLWSIEGLAVMVAVILATGVAFAMEFKSDNEFEVLNAKKDAIPVKVIRDGNVTQLSLEDVVVGELIQLEMGDEIPADGRILQATELMIDQSLMTGESVPVKKHQQALETKEEGPDKIGCVYRGTQVVDGMGQMLVAEVGDATYLGQIAKKLGTEGGDDDEEEEGAADTEEKRVKHKLTISKAMTPLQVKLTALAELISKVGYIAAILIFLALLVRGVIVSEVRFSPTFLVHDGQYVRNEKNEFVEYEYKTQKLAGIDKKIEELKSAGGKEEELKAAEAERKKVDEWTLESRGDALLTTAGSLLNYFVYMVIIIVVAVPEGLPMSVTVSLALAMSKMTRANSLVRQLVACETIGSATVICSDKTGTLTQNKMQVVRVFSDGQTIDRGGASWSLPEKDPAWPRDGKPLDWMVLNAAVNSTANLELKEGKMATVGNSTEGSLLQWLHEAGIMYNPLRHQFRELYQMHFSSERKRMTTVIKYGDRLIVLMKGASEIILEKTTQYQGADGTVKSWTPEERAKAEAWIKDSASQAMRTLGFAYAVLPMDTPTEEERLHDLRDKLEENLVFVGFVAIRDPLRDDVKEAVDQCRKAGIGVKMITGDNVETARAIANDIGLVDRRDAPIDSEGAVVLTSPRFNEMYDKWHNLRTKADRSGAEAAEMKAVEDQLADLQVLARARPLDKFKMVELLQSRQEVVGMTGDGTNDAPALKKADVGLAMGIAGTEVAKEASKIVLLDDAFSTIVKAVKWGRSLYENIQRFVQFQLTINVSALTIAFLGPFFGVRPPFTVLQLLWINVIMDTFASIALCSEPPRESVMDQKPKRKDENIVTPEMRTTILTTGAFFVVVMLGLLLLMDNFKLFAHEGEAVDPSMHVTPTQAGMFFTIYVFFQIFNMINCRALTPHTSGLDRFWENKAFMGIMGAIFVVQVLIATVPPIASIFKIGTIHNPLDWLWVILITATVLGFAEGVRRIRLAMAK